MTRSGILVATIALASACDSAPPSTPTRAPDSTVPVTSPPSPAPVTYHIPGVVLDDGDRPVGGAQVFLLDPRLTTITDADGRFEATVTLRQAGTEVLAQKPGYEPSSIDATANLRNDPGFRNLVRLYPITRIAVEEVRPLPLLDGAFSGGDGFPYVCRRVRIVASSDGVLTVDASPADYHLALPGPFLYPDMTTSHLSIRVSAGEIPIDVLLPGQLLNKVPPFTLRSVLAPGH